MNAVLEEQDAVLQGDRGRDMSHRGLFHTECTRATYMKITSQVSWEMNFAFQFNKFNIEIVNKLRII